MRFKSDVVDGFQVFAVAGTHTASFGIDASNADIKGLLGFAIEKIDKQTGTRRWIENFKVFKSLVPNPTPDQTFSSEKHPIQSFVWDSFTLYPGRKYEFVFHPFRGEPGKPDLTSTPITIAIQTEPTFDVTQEHDVFFNRGAASSQAYATKFDNKAPDHQDTPAKCKQAFEWLERGLFTAMKKFIDSAQAGETIHGCFYEFHYAPIVQALADAANRGVNVLLVVDGKNNEYTDKNGKFHPSTTPREANIKAMTDAQLPVACYRLRQARKNDLQHNKFMVLHRAGAPAELWTGSTNVSLNGIFGQTNVGHWVRNAAVAQQYEKYFQLLLQDPGGHEGQTPAQVHEANAAFYASVDALAPVPAKFDDIPAGVTAMFSPRSTLDPLKRYAEGVGDADALACITLAFGVGQEIRNALIQNDKNSAPTFLLLERQDEKNPSSNKPFVKLDTTNNVYEAWGSYLKDPLYKWTRETNLFKVGVATNVAYIHTKFLLHDPLGPDPIVITGSANFSDASVHIGNDENMLWIRGNHRTADIYFTEFNRLFYHYFFRSVVERLGDDDDGNSRFLDETTSWLAKYEPGTLRSKRVGEFRSMHVPVPGA